MSLEEDITLLAQVSFFRDFSTDVLRLVAFAAEQRDVSKGAVLFRKGEKSDGGYIVSHGSFSLIDNVDEPPKRVAMRGTLLGELALISDTRRPVTAVARETSTVLRLPRATFRRMLEEYPQLTRSLHSSLRARVLQVSSELSVVKHKFRGRDR